MFAPSITTIVTIVVSGALAAMVTAHRDGGMIPNSVRARSLDKTETTGNRPTWLACSAKSLSNGGCGACSFPAERAGFTKPRITSK